MLRLIAATRHVVVAAALLTTTTFALTPTTVAVSGGPFSVSLSEGVCVPLAQPSWVRRVFLQRTSGGISCGNASASGHFMCLDGPEHESLVFVVLNDTTANPNPPSTASSAAGGDEGATTTRLPMQGLSNNGIVADENTTIVDRLEANLHTATTLDLWAPRWVRADEVCVYISNGAGWAVAPTFDPAVAPNSSDLQAAIEIETLVLDQSSAPADPYTEAVLSCSSSAAAVSVDQPTAGSVPASVEFAIDPAAALAPRDCFVGLANADVSRGVVRHFGGDSSSSATVHSVVMTNVAVDTTPRPTSGGEAPSSTRATRGDGGAVGIFANVEHSVILEDVTVTGGFIVISLVGQLKNVSIVLKRVHVTTAGTRAGIVVRCPKCMGLSLLIEDSTVVSTSVLVAGVLIEGGSYSSVTIRNTTIDLTFVKGPHSEFCQPVSKVTGCAAVLYTNVSSIESEVLDGNRVTIQEGASASQPVALTKYVPNDDTGHDRIDVSSNNVSLVSTEGRILVFAPTLTSGHRVSVRGNTFYISSAGSINALDFSGDVGGVDVLSNTFSAANADGGSFISFSPARVASPVRIRRNSAQVLGSNSVFRIVAWYMDGITSPDAFNSTFDISENELISDSNRAWPRVFMFHFLSQPSPLGTVHIWHNRIRATHALRTDGEVFEQYGGLMPGRFVFAKNTIDGGSISGTGSFYLAALSQGSTMVFEDNTFTTTAPSTVFITALLLDPSSSVVMKCNTLNAVDLTSASLPAAFAAVATDRPCITGSRSMTPSVSVSATRPGEFEFVDSVALNANSTTGTTPSSCVALAQPRWVRRIQLRRKDRSLKCSPSPGRGASSASQNSTPQPSPSSSSPASSSSFSEDSGPNSGGAFSCAAYPESQILIAATLKNNSTNNGSGSGSTDVDAPASVFHAPKEGFSNNGVFRDGDDIHIDRAAANMHDLDVTSLELWAEGLAWTTHVCLSVLDPLKKLTNVSTVYDVFVDFEEGSANAQPEDSRTENLTSPCFASTVAAAASPSAVFGRSVRIGIAAGAATPSLCVLGLTNAVLTRGMIRHDGNESATVGSVVLMNVTADVTPRVEASAPFVNPLAPTVGDGGLVAISANVARSVILEDVTVTGGFIMISLVGQRENVSIVVKRVHVTTAGTRAGIVVRCPTCTGLSLLIEDSTVVSTSVLVAGILIEGGNYSSVTIRNTTIDLTFVKGPHSVLCGPTTSMNDGCGAVMYAGVTSILTETISDCNVTITEGASRSRPLSLVKIAPSFFTPSTSLSSASSSSPELRLLSRSISVTNTSVHAVSTTYKGPIHVIDRALDGAESLLFVADCKFSFFAPHAALFGVRITGNVSTDVTISRNHFSMGGGYTASAIFFAPSSVSRNLTFDENTVDVRSDTENALPVSLSFWSMSSASFNAALTFTGNAITDHSLGAMPCMFMITDLKFPSHNAAISISNNTLVADRPASQVGDVVTVYRSALPGVLDVKWNTMSFLGAFQTTVIDIERFTAHTSVTIEGNVVSSVSTVAVFRTPTMVDPTAGIGFQCNSWNGAAVGVGDLQDPLNTNATEGSCPT